VLLVVLLVGAVLLILRILHIEMKLATNGTIGAAGVEKKEVQ
jgi:hypothetical protein